MKEERFKRTRFLSYFLRRAVPSLPPSGYSQDQRSVRIYSIYMYIYAAHLQRLVAAALCRRLSGTYRENEANSTRSYVRSSSAGDRIITRQKIRQNWREKSLTYTYFATLYVENVLFSSVLFHVTLPWKIISLNYNRGLSARLPSPPCTYIYSFSTICPWPWPWCGVNPRFIDVRAQSTKSLPAVTCHWIQLI